MSIILSILLLITAVYGLIVALNKRSVISILVAIGFIISTIILYLSPSGLFYHSVALSVISAITLSILMLISQERTSSRQRVLALLVTVPYIMLCSFKVLQLQGVQVLTLGLYLSIGAFLFYSLDRRIWDHYWALLLFIALSSLSILLQ